MIKTILTKEIIFLISGVISVLLFSNFLTDLLYRFLNPSMLVIISMMLITAFILYVIIISIMEKKVSRININIVMGLYFVVVIGLSFFRSFSNYSGMNLNPLNIINDYKDYPNLTLLLVITNLLIYLPLGIFIRIKMKVSTHKLIIGFLIYIFLIESMQYISHKGVFDINDIILNSLGFVIGICLAKIKYKSSEVNNVRY